MNWTCIDIAIECKMHSTDDDPFDAARDMHEPVAVGPREVLGQVLDYARLIFLYQQRTFQFMVLFPGDMARIIRIDHSGIFATNKFKYKAVATTHPGATVSTPLLVSTPTAVHASVTISTSIIPGATAPMSAVCVPQACPSVFDLPAFSFAPEALPLPWPWGYDLAMHPSLGVVPHHYTLITHQVGLPFQTPLWCESTIPSYLPGAFLCDSPAQRLSHLECSPSLAHHPPHCTHDFLPRNAV
ncbi:hypothetical protein C8Q78DRAFT_1063293 [Trametes maxima]|nr:hypothetical protein C8Q78DRAFT_1063293 [Trametes maxima]